MVEWPQTGERIVGRANVVGLTRAYPEGWAITVDEILDAGDTVVLRAWIDHPTAPTYAIGFYDVRDGRIARATEFFADLYDPPAGREQWVVRYEPR